MSIVSSANMYLYLGITEENYFTITAGNDTLILTYDTGSATEVSISDGTYNGDDLAAALETAIDTAFTITSTVAYDSDTRKFTITVATGHTLTYTHTGSDAGLTFGFNQNHAAAKTQTSDIAAGSPTEIVDVLHNAVEDFVKSFCGRTFESTSYSLEKYDGKGVNYLNLKNYPVTALTRITVGTSTPLRIKNTYTYTKASVSVTSTGIILSRNGDTDATLLFADYATITLLTAAINAVGYGWVAEIADSSYASFASSELIEKFGLNCINDNYVDLLIPNEDAEYDFNVIADEGTVLFNRNIPVRSQYIFVDYTAGYSTTTMPNDLSLAVKIFTKYLYQRMNEETFGVSDFSLGDSSASIEKVMPSEVKAILNRYRRRFV